MPTIFRMYLNLCMDLNSKYIIFGSGSRNMHYFASGSEQFYMVTLSVLKDKTFKEYFYQKKLKKLYKNNGR